MGGDPPLALGRGGVSTGVDRVGAALVGAFCNLDRKGSEELSVEVVRQLTAELDPALMGRLTVGGRAAYEADFTAAVVVQRYLTLFQRLSGGVLPDTGRAAREEENTWPRPTI